MPVSKLIRWELNCWLVSASRIFCGGMDYPHIEGSWPHSEPTIASWSKNLSREQLAKIIGLNSAKLFNIPVPSRFQHATA